MKNTFENAQTSDRVWSMHHGWGVVTHVSDPKILVRFDHLKWNGIFTICGKYCTKDLNPTLFWNEVKIDIPQKPVKTKLIHGVEVPDITFKPTLDEQFYYPSIECMSFHKLREYSDYGWCKFLSENNLCYPYSDIGKAAAMLHTKAMLGIKNNHNQNTNTSTI
jgi:hypothetical protein